MGQGQIVEDDVQEAVVEWLRLVQKRRNFLFWHTPNGGSRNVAEARKFQRLGVLPGVPDITIQFPDARVIHLECKKPGGRPSRDQRVFAEWCEANRVPCYIVTNLRDAERFVNGAMREMGLL